MKIAIVTNFLYPEKIGGTELFCYQLAEALLFHGHDVYWIVPHFNTHTTVTSTHTNGLKIIRFAAVQEGLKPTAAFVSASFIKEMNQRQIKVAHFNEFGGFEGISHTLLRETKNAGIRTIVTLHLVHYFCKTGTMRYGGLLQCDGKVIPSRCGSCNIFSEISPSENINYLLTNTFRAVFNLMDKSQLYMLPKIKSVVKNFNDRLPFIESLKDRADIIVSITKWFREVLIVNGIPTDKIKYIPQVTPNILPAAISTIQQPRKGYVFIGRINKEKGINLLIKAAAILAQKAPHVFIDLYGPIPTGKEYPQHFMEEKEKYKNIRYQKLLQPEDVLPTIIKYKAVLLPSLVSEMAPLIITEANKLNVPVIASAVPGSIELINEYDCGLIFDYNSAASLVEKILLIENTSQSFKFKSAFENTYKDVALKYLNLYQDLNAQPENLINHTY